MPLEDLYLGYQKTALQPGEFVVAVRVPLRAPRPARARVQDQQALRPGHLRGLRLLRAHVDGARIASARIGCGGVAPVAEARDGDRSCARRPAVWNDATADAAVRAIAAEFTPIDDMRASAAYRRAVLGNLVRRFRLETCGGAVRDAHRAGRGADGTPEALHPRTHAPSMDRTATSAAKRPRRTRSARRCRTTPPRCTSPARRTTRTTCRSRAARCTSPLGVSPVAHGRLRGARPRGGARGAGRGRRDHRRRHSRRQRRRPDPARRSDLRARRSVEFVGQPVFAVVATDVASARRAARLARSTSSRCRRS